ncbi:hypothetical protein BD410DRAFT_444492 [Rickenella mellea]|uniref:Uncharacterized protein n=1 Tax=Rickenella mellea TaxID=50990 RepID=A0A4Y7PW60_9AGAM|nr:hypothetical protein BD410DRAFT_444492 [Rickenella mellea]
MDVVHILLEHGSHPDRPDKHGVARDARARQWLSRVHGCYQGVENGVRGRLPLSLPPIHDPDGCLMVQMDQMSSGRSITRCTY